MNASESEAVLEFGDWRNPAEADAVYDILCRCDGEFVPPLSARLDCAQNSFGDESRSAAGDEPGRPRAYFETLRGEPLLLARVDGRVAGMLTFQHGVTMKPFGGMCPTNYISTLCVHPDFRGRKLAPAFYRFMLGKLPPELAAPFTGTRTWSGNAAQTRLLKRFGFVITTRLPDHRGPGVDTLYLAVAND